MNNRNILLDVLKGIAIIAVILYHCKLLRYGYLGVETFLVIGGYLITKSIMKTTVGGGNLNYWKYLNTRLVRLWPLLLIVSAVTFVLGWFWMLPQTFKMTCEMVIASDLFVNNIVQYVTSGNYWNSSNDYYPLMHTWYIGVMFQFYLIYPLIFIVAKKRCKDFKKGLSNILWGVFIVSLLLYALPIFTTAQNFYLLPSRLFEFAAGGLIAVSAKNYNSFKNGKLTMSIGLIIVLLLLTINSNMEVEKWRLLATVALSTVFVIIAERNVSISSNTVFKSLALIGAASYSLYLCHQVILAFYRYTVNDIFTWETYLLMISLSFTVGLLVFFLLEKPLGNFVKSNTRKTYFINASCFVCLVLLAIPSFHYYKQQGMVRDLPEFEMYLGQNSESPFDYNSRTMRYDKDFDKNGRKNILVIGDSFGRDFVNVLLESGVDSVMNISYHADFDDVLKSRINQADYIFVASIMELNTKYPDLLPMVIHKNFYRVGNKSYGSCIGIIYNNDRYDSNYCSQRVYENKSSIAYNTKEKALYGNAFVDMMDILKDDKGMIPIFYDNRCITEDGIHITHAGAQMYAKCLNVWKYLN